MGKLRAFLSRLKAPLIGERQDRDLAVELDAHLQMLTDDNIRAGCSSEEARRQARIKLGGIESVKENCRDRRGIPLIESIMQDLRYAGRGLRRNPGFTLTIVLILALGIGANTAVFSIVNGVLLKPLPYRDPDRIVTLSNPLTTGESPTALAVKVVSIPNFQDWHDQSSSFEAMASYQSGDTPVMPGPTAEYAEVTRVSPEFFRVFGVEPAVGRFFSVEEVKPSGGGALMISYAYWQGHFGGDARVLGRTIRVYDRPLPIVGVLPPGFRFPGKTDLWIPLKLTYDVNAQNRKAQNYYAVGRLKPGVSLEHAQTEMTVIARRLELQYPDSNKGRTVAVTRMRDEMVGDIRLTLYLLLGAGSVVLLIACANTATLLLGKAAARAREVAVRVALGASRRRIVRQLITESLLLSFVAGVSGLLLAYWGSKALVALAPAALPLLAETGIDARVLAFTLGISLTTSLLFGLLPAIHASKVDLIGTLKQAATRSVTGGGMVRMRGMLVVAEIALAVVLLSGAGLLTRSFVALQNVALGFRPENTLVMRASGPGSIRDASLFFKDVLSQVAALPGVLAAGAAMEPPGRIGSTGLWFVDYMPVRWDVTGPGAEMSIVAPGTFAALGIPLTSGRDFNDSDTSDRPFVAVVNQALVRKSFPGENPIGRTIFCTFDSVKGMTIIGVVGDVRQSGPAREPMPECYMTYRQHAYNNTTLSVIVRTAGDPTALTQTLRRLAHARAPDVPVSFTTMAARLSENVAAPRFRTLLFALFAALAVCLAMAGVYGVTAYAAGQRSSEIGLRMALGASTSSVLRLILGQGMVLAGAGLALGLAAALAGARLLTTLLFQVQPNDPPVYLAVTVLLGVVALVASYVPARRASQVDPAVALRDE